MSTNQGAAKLSQLRRVGSLVNQLTARALQTTLTRRTMAVQLRVILLLLALAVVAVSATDHITISENMKVGSKIWLEQLDKMFLHATDMGQINIVNSQVLGPSKFEVVFSPTLDQLKAELDREALCPKQTQQFFEVQGDYFRPYDDSQRYFEKEDDCIFTVMLVNARGDSSRVTIRVHDSNDNRPEWNIVDRPLVIEFPESIAESDTTIPLPLAQDKDIDKNGVIRYKLESNRLSQHDITSVFKLVKTSEENLVLQALEPLDREKYPQGWTGFLVATDEGLENTQTNRLPLLIKLSDVNDNAPVFDRELYEANRVLERTPVNTTLLILQAKDEDEGVNSKLTYEIVSNQALVKRFFRMTADGHLKLAAPLQLDREGANEALDQGTLTFKVRATDSAPSAYRKSSETTVKLHLVDENDEKPRILVHPVIVRDDGAAGVRENMENQLIAYITVSDSDYQGQDRVECYLDDHHNFRLENKTTLSLARSPASTGTDELNLFSNRAWDREAQEVILVKISCHDSADHSTQQSIRILVMDANDNAPQFTLPEYKFKLRENVGMELVVGRIDQKRWIGSVGRVQATDLDHGSNAHIEYSLEPSSRMVSGHTYDYNRNSTKQSQHTFNVDPQSGEILQTQNIDREQQAMYRFTVVARDQDKERQLSSTAQVEIEIADENDNPPTFDKSAYYFLFTETGQKGQFVGQVSAIDPDEISTNQLLYAIKLSHDSEKFAIDPKEGKITNLYSIDRERKDNYGFHVLVMDGISKPNAITFTTSVSVEIRIQDVNDNAPTFRRPNPQSNLVFMQPDTPIGHKLFSVLAEDRDIGDNGRVHYEIINGNEEGLFKLDSPTGDLYLDRPIPPASMQSILQHQARQQGQALDNNGHESGRKLPAYLLNLRACDFGDPRRCTEYPNFKIQVSTFRPEISQNNWLSPDGSSGSGGSLSQLTKVELLAVVLSVLFSILVIVVVVGVLVFRCRGRPALLSPGTGAGPVIYKDEARYSKALRQSVFGPDAELLYGQTMLRSDYPIGKTTHGFYKNATLLSPRFRVPISASANSPDELMMLYASNRDNGYGVLGPTQLMQQPSAHPLAFEHEYQSIESRGFEVDGETAKTGLCDGASSSCCSEEVVRISQAARDKSPTSNELSQFIPGEPLPASYSQPKATFV